MLVLRGKNARNSLKSLNNMSKHDTLSFLSAANPDYIADLYAKYDANPSSVDGSWADLFSSLGGEAKSMIAELKGASWTPAPEKLAAVLSSAANEESAKPAAKKDDKKSAAPSLCFDLLCRRKTKGANSRNRTRTQRWLSQLLRRDKISSRA